MGLCMLHFAGITGIGGELRLPSGLGIFHQPGKP